MDLWWKILSLCWFICESASVFPLPDELDAGNNGFQEMDVETQNYCEIAKYNYQFLISQQFKQGSVIPNINLLCECESESSWEMLCEIVVAADSAQERVVRWRLEQPDPMKLQPFFHVEFMEELSTPPLTLTLFHFPCYPHPVVAQITIAPISLQPQPKIIHRTLSSPPDFHYPIKSIDIHLCTRGSPDAMCPIMHTPFEHHGIVYILNEDAWKIPQKKPVVCLSAEGLRKWSSTQSDRRFSDPLRRESHRFLTLQDYTAYVLIGQPDEACDGSKLDTIPESPLRSALLDSHAFVKNKLIVSVIFFIFFILLFIIHSFSTSKTGDMLYVELLQ